MSEVSNETLATMIESLEDRSNERHETLVKRADERHAENVDRLEEIKADVHEGSRRLAEVERRQLRDFERINRLDERLREHADTLDDHAEHVADYSRRLITLELLPRRNSREGRDLDAADRKRFAKLAGGLLLTGGILMKVLELLWEVSKHGLN